MLKQAQMKKGRENSVEINEQKREFQNSLTIGLLAFMVTFALLRWVIA